MTTRLSVLGSHSSMDMIIGMVSGSTDMADIGMMEDGKVLLKI